MVSKILIVMALACFVAPGKIQPINYIIKWSFKVKIIVIYVVHVGTM